jgi:segregation and condensation protein B
MSLKAKIEAVIYASEEPVTLAQLAGLLGQEAQLELDRLAMDQGSLLLEDDLAAGDLEAPAAQQEALASVVDSAAVFGDDHAGADLDAPESGSEKRQARERERKLREFLREIIDRLMQEYATSDRGLEVREVAGGYRMGTKPEYHDAVRGFVRSLKPPLKLTLQALETLAVVAYKQPVTAPEVSEIRGVDSGGVMGSLMTRKLVTTAGRKQVVGRPILYKTTKDFLLRFGLKDINELPSIEEFEKLAGELAEQEEITMPEQAESPREQAEERITLENLQEEKDATAPQADGDDTNLDGRLSGLDPDYSADDPSAEDAAAQALNRSQETE